MSRELELLRMYCTAWRLQGGRTRHTDMQAMQVSRAAMPSLPCKSAALHRTAYSPGRPQL